MDINKFIIIYLLQELQNVDHDRMLINSIVQNRRSNARSKIPA